MQKKEAAPARAAREELARHAAAGWTRDAVELAAEWAGVETQLEDDTQKELAKEVADLTRSAQQSKTDGVAAAGSSSWRRSSAARRDRPPWGS